MELQNPCRICGRADPHIFLDFGLMPLANQFLKAAEQNGTIARYPLDVAYCDACGAVQIGRTVDPKLLFSDYIYRSSTANGTKIHGRQLASSLIERFSLNPGRTVLEIGSNDGCVLENFKRHGCSVLGVDPAANVAAVAIAGGIDTMVDFFSRRTADAICARYGQPDLILARNVAAHIPDIHDFADGLARLLHGQGVAVIECPYALRMIDGNAFDTIYHEHVFYFSLRSISALMLLHGLEVFDMETNDMHGGSAVYYIAKKGRRAVTPGIEAVRDFEMKEYSRIEAYDAFAERASDIQGRLKALLGQLKQAGCRVAAYGAAAKGNTLLVSSGIGADLVSCIYDKSPEKQGLFAPGSGIPVRPAHMLVDDKPTHVLILAWNFSEEIIAQQADFQRQGGRFIIPVPDIRIV